jgi:endonuclease/exonuclease/phosphatase family metal-dependent hydrolase
MPRRQYVEEVDTICNAIRRILPENADLLLAGDFNFRSLGMRRAGESLKTTKAESRVLANIESLGVKSCWLTIHPNEPLRQTLRWKRDVTKPYHCDGIFAPPKWIETSVCEVLTAPWLKSDHNPIAAWLSPRSTGPAMADQGVLPSQAGQRER